MLFVHRPLPAVAAVFHDDSVLSVKYFCFAIKTQLILTVYSSKLTKGVAAPILNLKFHVILPPSLCIFQGNGELRVSGDGLAKRSATAAAGYFCFVGGPTITLHRSRALRLDEPEETKEEPAAVQGFLILIQNYILNLQKMLIGLLPRFIDPA